MDHVNKIRSANVLCVSLNPAVDQTISLPRFEMGKVNRAKSLCLHAGGKGVNVASFLAAAGCNVTVTGFLGRENEAIFTDFFTRKGIQDRCIRLPGLTRVGVKIINEALQETTDINLPGLAPSQPEVDSLIQTVTQLASRCQWIVLTGSLPPAILADFYARLIRIARSSGCEAILDTSQPALSPALESGPRMIKPNLVELEELVGRRLSSPEEIQQAVNHLFQRGVELAAVSMGERGALLISPNQTLRVHPRQVKVQSTVGAGDAMVAGLLVSALLGLDLAVSAQLAVAFSSAAVSSLDRELPGLEDLLKISREITVEDLSSGRIT
jgi:1-phosphofructokinase